VKTSQFDYELPESAIAQQPLEHRDGSRLLELGRDGVRHLPFRSFPSLVPEGALVILNDTRVIKARILGTRHGTGGRVELLLTRLLSTESEASEIWCSLGRAGGKLRPGTRIDAGPISVEVLSRDDDGSLRVRVFAEGGVARALDVHGHVPLPPYVRRPDSAADVERYQTVFARHSGSIAAPTAALHLTPDTLRALAARGVEVAFVTLHVGIGTFRPVSAEDLDEHPMHSEELVVGPDVVRAVRRARERNGRVVAVGTTVVRALESAKDPTDPRMIRELSGDTALLIQPGYDFGPVDSLLTNFHMPKSTLMALVAAFAGRERVLSAYAEALAERYRFLSYGDAMWIPERLT